MSDDRIHEAHELAARVREPEKRELLLNAINTAIMHGKIIDEATQLVAYWRAMPEFITGSQAIAHLETVLAGGRAPRSSAAPKK